MKGLIQRVNHARVTIDGETVGQIGRGILLLLGIEKGDTEASADKLLHKVMGYRIFPDQHGRMNLSLADTGGELLIVSQFTLVADTRKGMRPAFPRVRLPKKGSGCTTTSGNRRPCACPASPPGVSAPICGSPWRTTGRSPLCWKPPLSFNLV